MKTFDWNDPVFKAHRPQVQSFIRKNHKRKMTEDEFVTGMKALHLPRLSPSKCKQNYQNLKTNFGFFV